MTAYRWARPALRARHGRIEIRLNCRTRRARYGKLPFAWWTLTPSVYSARGGANPVAYFARPDFAFPPDVFWATAARTSALNAPASTSSPSWMSIARLTFPSRLELKSLAASFNEAPLAKVNFTIDL